jgi:hypothetical protein
VLAAVAAQAVVGGSGGSADADAPGTFRGDIKHNKNIRKDRNGWKYINELAARHGGFAGKDLSNMTFQQCIFSVPGNNLPLTDMKLDNVLFDGCWFEGAHFGRQQTPVTSNFLMCNFKNARFDGAEFSNRAMFDVCDFTNADFRKYAGAELPRIAMAGSNLHGIKIHERHLPGLQRQPFLANMDVHVFNDEGTSRTLRYDHRGKMKDMGAHGERKADHTSDRRGERPQDRADRTSRSDAHGGGSADGAEPRHAMTMQDVRDQGLAQQVLRRIRKVPHRTCMAVAAIRLGWVIAGAVTRG